MYIILKPVLNNEDLNDEFQESKVFFLECFTTYSDRFS